MSVFIALYQVLVFCLSKETVNYMAVKCGLNELSMMFTCDLVQPQIAFDTWIGSCVHQDQINLLVVSATSDGVLWEAAVRSALQNRCS